MKNNYMLIRRANSHIYEIIYKTPCGQMVDTGTVNLATGSVMFRSACVAVNTVLCVAELIKAEREK